MKVSDVSILRCMCLCVSTIVTSDCYFERVCVIKNVYVLTVSIFVCVCVCVKMLVTNVMCGIVSVIEDCVCVCENVFVCVRCIMQKPQTSLQKANRQQTHNTKRTDKAR